MDDHGSTHRKGNTGSCGCGPGCGCHRGSPAIGPDGSRNLNRRRFFSLSAAAASAAILAAHSRDALAAGKLPNRSLVPVDKGTLTAADLYARGTPTSYTGEALRLIGMPVGGGCCGQVYLGGDGQLWYWDIDNGPAPSEVNSGGPTYASPEAPFTPFGNGLVLKVTAGGQTTVLPLDSSGFDQVTFTGQYPIGQVDYSSSGLPVTARLEAFSPFIPGNVDDSTIPVTVLACTLTNTSSSPVEAELTGWAENPVCLRSRSGQPIMLSSGSIGGGRGNVAYGGVQFTAANEPLPADDIVFEDWEGSGGYPSSWSVTGQAFGSGPVLVSEVPSYMLSSGDLHAQGPQFVTSHNFLLANGDVGLADSYTGTLTSQPFTIQHRYIAAWVGGGDHPQSQPGETAFNVIVDGQVVGSLTGLNREPMTLQYVDVSAHQGQTAQIQIVDDATGAWGHINVSNIVFTDKADILFEDWEESGGYPSSWSVTGQAFGSGPVTVAEVAADASYMLRFGDLNAQGPQFVTSHNFLLANGDVGLADSYTGTLTSQPFTIQRRYITAWVGGGNHPQSQPGETAFNVIVDGQVVGSLVGNDTEPMSLQYLDVIAYQGKTAQIQIVDDNTGGWGHINVSNIVFTDMPSNTPISELPDGGTAAVTAFSPAAVVRPSLADWSTPEAIASSGPGPASIDGGLGTIAGAVTVPVQLDPGESTTVRLGFSWYFPVPDRGSLAFLDDIGTLQRHYAARFSSAGDVAAYLATNLGQLEDATRTWVRTWYADSTLPYWFLERTMASASTLSTSTCLKFDSGRFYAWEGVDCCAGTCEHVWNYAQAIARLFPPLESDTRERVDLGIALNPNGEIGNRAEADMTWATDGQCGTILRIYREHQMSPDSSFLTRNWPKIKLAIGWVMSQDTRHDGTLEGPQPNTLDTTWYGEIAWMTGMYDAALYACAEMATEVGDSAFAKQCLALAEAGANSIATDLWTGEYFIQLIDPNHASAPNSNIGCEIDQMFGQSLALQLGLPRVFPLDKAQTALGSLYTYNFVPDPAAYRAANPSLGGRDFAGPGEPGMVQCTFPHGGEQTIDGAPYFGETWTGQEHQVATHMIYDGLVDQGMTVINAVNNRYSATKRNPYNEIECSEHYARAMAAYGVFLAASGYSYHGPLERLGFAPKISPDNFAAAFTAAQGWGLYQQSRSANQQLCSVEVRYGQLTIGTFSMELPEPPDPARLRVTAQQNQDATVQVASVSVDGTTVEATFSSPAVITAGQRLHVTATTG